MVSDRRLVHTLLVNWIWTLSLLLVVCGLVTFVVFVGHPSTDRWTEAAKLLGATLFQVGAISLILELVNLERLVGSKVPEALLEHGYLEGLRDERLDDLIERAIHARFAGIADDDVRLARRRPAPTTSASRRSGSRASRPSSSRRRRYRPRTTSSSCPTTASTTAACSIPGRP